MLRPFRLLVLGLAVIAIASKLSSNLLAVEVVLHVAPGGSDQALGEADSPLATPHGAIERLPEIARRVPDAHLRVLLRDGIYAIEHPLTIERQHVPAQGQLTFAAASHAKALISGGRRLTGWQVNDNGSWSVAIPPATSGQWTFRELFVEGQRRPRARHPNTGYLRIDTAFDDKRSGFTFGDDELPSSWFTGGELVFLHDWSTSRIPIEHVDHENRRLKVAFPIGNRAAHYKIDHFEQHPRYCVEGHRTFLDAPGEWLLDQGTLHYLPLPGENPESLEVIAPLAEVLLSVTGDDQEPIRNVNFEGINFAHCAWQLPPHGFAGSQATAHEQRGQQTAGSSRNFVPAAIRFEHAENCSVTRGNIAHLGTSGIQFGSRTKNCRLEDCVINDVSGNGVNLGEDTSRLVAGRPWWQTAPDQVAAGNLVQYNCIEHCGQQFFGAVGVWVGIAREMQIANNEIAWHPYTGVSLGWMWNPTLTPAGENVVSQNHIHHVMQVLSDGGGIYSLGRQPATRLVENVIHHVPLNAGRAESNGMFIDEGSDQLEIVGNTIYGVVRSPLRFHRAEQVSVRDNVLVVPTHDTPMIRYNSTNADTIQQAGNRVVAAAEFDETQVVLPRTGPREENMP